jgi:cell wall-associated NlpC family hydrolase
VRECVQVVYGGKYDAWWMDSALHTAQRFLKRRPAGVKVIRTKKIEDTQLGDLLYCTVGHGGYGHVGIRVAGNRVAENSVIHSGPHGVIGFRSLAEFDFDVVVRLPDPAA